MADPNEHRSVAQLAGSPRRRYYAGPDPARAVTVADLRAGAHRRLPRFVLEYLEGGAEEEATLARERAAYADWRFTPRQLVDVSQRSLATTILGRAAPWPLIVAPTGLNGLFRHHADTMLAQAAAAEGVPFVQSTMSNDTVEEVARVPGLRHWWQLYVFGGDEVWQELLRRVDAAGCEALVLTTNAQIFGNREWSARTRATRTRPSLGTAVDALLHPRWLASTLLAHGMPVFRNVIDFIPREQRGFFASAFWIREHQPQSLSWNTVDRIRRRWRKPLLLKGILHLDDVRRALDAGVDGIVLGSHGGRQLDWTVAALDLLPSRPRHRARSPGAVRLRRRATRDRSAQGGSARRRRGHVRPRAAVRRLCRGDRGCAARAGDPEAGSPRCAGTARREWRRRAALGAAGAGHPSAHRCRAAAVKSCMPSWPPPAPPPEASARSYGEPRARLTGRAPAPRRDSRAIRPSPRKLLMTASMMAALLATVGCLLSTAPALAAGTDHQSSAAARASHRHHPEHGARRQVGKASIYARKFAGRKMANGAIMKPADDNAASKTLPLGTTARVTNLENGKSTVVTIEDRGPHVRGRIVDLSPGSAAEIGVTKHQGVAQVAVEPIAVPRDGGAPAAGRRAK
jgi:(S)-mandelate dehydrogenase